MSSKETELKVKLEDIVILADGLKDLAKEVYHLNCLMLLSQEKNK